MRRHKTKIESNLGRMASPLHKYLAHIRWMGGKVAVYDLSCPRESGVKGRKVPYVRRRNRRGCRSRRGGRKRRALAGAAPTTPILRHPPNVLGLNTRSISRRFDRKCRYSANLISYFVNLRGIRMKLKEQIRNLPSGTLAPEGIWKERWSKINSTLTRLRRSWFTYAATTEGSSRIFNEVRFLALTEGVDELWSIKRRSLSRRALEKLEADWYGELQLEVPSDVGPSEERPKDHVYECTRCMRVTNIPICRLCGDDLSSHDLYNRRPGRKTRRHPAPRRNWTSKPTERKR
jgi:hypothetical protein